MKQIWWINHHAVPPVVPGGTRHFSLAHEIMVLGDYKVTVINGSFDHITPHFPEGADFGAKLRAPVMRGYDGVDFYTLPTPYYKGNASLGRVKNMLAFYKNALKYLSPRDRAAELAAPYMIIGSVVHPLAAYAGYKLSLLYNVPFVYEVRDLWPLSLVEVGKISKYNPISLFLGYLDRRMATAAKLIITTAPLMKNYYIGKYGISEDKFVWVTNGTYLIQNVPQPMRTITENDVLRIGYTGVLGYANGLLDFVKAISTLPVELRNRFSFTFVGSGPLKEAIKKYIEEHSLSNVTLMEPVPKKEVWNLLSGFDMLLFCLNKSPIFRYGISPNKLADYHAAGRPIIEILSAHESPVLMAKSGYHIDDISKFHSLLLQILKDDGSVYTSMAKNAREFAAEYYDWKRLALRLNQALKRATEVTE